MAELNPKEKVRHTISAFWETKKLKAQMEIEFQKTVFQPKAKTYLEDIKKKIKAENEVIARIVDSHTREDREKRQIAQEKLTHLEKALAVQEGEIERSDKIIEQAPFVIEEANSYLNIIKNLKE